VWHLALQGLESDNKQDTRRSDGIRSSPAGQLESSSSAILSRVLVTIDGVSTG
jgi:hypothetical protein